MLKFICIFVLLASLCIAAPTLYVVQTLDESAATIEIETGEVHQHAATLGTIPNDIIVHNNRAYIANSGYNNIQEIDGETAATVREIQIPGGVNVWSMAMLNDDTMAVTCSVSNNVIAVRLSDEQVVRTLPAGPSTQAILVHGDYFYVGVTGVSYPQFGPASILVFDRYSLSRIDSIPVAKNPQGLAVDEFNRLHVVCTGDYGSVTGEVDIIDLESREVTDEIAIGGTPSNISIGGGIAYIAAGGWGAEGWAYSYRVSDLQVLHGSGNPLITGSGAFDIEAFSDGSFFVSCFNDDAVEYRDRNGDLIQSFPLSDGPAQMAVYRGPEAANYDSRSVPESIVLADPYPNPFNGNVRLDLNLAAKYDTNILIYNEIGQVVRVLSIPAGYRSIIWNGLDQSGSAVSSGIYIAKMTSKQDNSSKRIILLK
jgi:hypothetical protein